MSLSDSMRLLVEALDRAGVAYMVTGSLASGYHGETRSTQDVDLVVDPSPDALDRFVESLDPDRFYVGDHRGALDRRAMFNVIDITNGWKFDLIVRRARPFSAEEFGRRKAAMIDGLDVPVASAEDIVLSKLEWSKQSRSDRQRADVVAVVRANRDTLDRAYLERWAPRLGVADELHQIIDEGN